MKKILCLVLIILLLFCGATVYAETKGAYKYSVKYVTDSETRIKNTDVLTRQETVEYTISRTVPDKEGYTFLGWSTETQDYINEPLYQPAQKIELNSSVTFYAIWKDDGMKVLSYQDEIFPSQLTTDGKVRVTEQIPKQENAVFCGWKAEGAEDDSLILPGQVISPSKDTILVPVWAEDSKVYGDFELTVTETEEPDIQFECSGCERFDSHNIIICDLAADKTVEYDCNGDSLLVDDFNQGQYKAYILANKNGIEYKSNTVNFVVKDKNPNHLNPLTVYMDGKLLTFDMPPVLLDGHTFVTLRYFCEYVGADVYWDQSNAAANITYNGKRIKIKENSDICVVNGEIHNLPAQTRIISDRMFIPLRSVAEFLNCQVVWDASRKVYIFTESVNVFDHNMFNISDREGNYLGLKNGVLSVNKKPDFDSVWIFDTVDGEKGIYRIYNLGQLDKPLEVKLSEVSEGQLVRIWEETEYDGHLWKVSANTDGSYSISPANNTEYFLDISEKCIKKEPQGVFLEGVYR